MPGRKVGVFLFYFLLSLVKLWAQDQARTESFLGNLAPIIRSIQQETGFPLAYENCKGMSVKEWQRRGRAELERTLCYSPKPVPLDVKVESVMPREGYEIRKISFAGSQHYRIPAYLLVPTETKPPFPAVVALHDHGGFFYYGKEKLVRLDTEHPALTEFKGTSYGGRSWADELARRGFVVIVADAFYWGERRLQYEQPPLELENRLSGLKPEQIEYVKAINAYLRDRNSELNTWLAFAGTSWLGIVNHDDRRTVDLLHSLPEVDHRRIGCAGLSGGGYRATYLAGADPRVKASIIVGWMTSLPTTLDIPYSVHSNLFDAFGLHAKLDHPDVASLAAPNGAIFIQNCARDRLFTSSGMRQATLKIQKVYEDLGRSQYFSSKLYDVPHQFNVQMQEDAFNWLEKNLR
ncbi:MAG: dienelactone hydrolase family protein [Terriglobia bacterium]